LKNMGTICYVILNYNTYNEAICCADSILTTQKDDGIKIILVDNGSKNDSVTQLNAYTEGKEQVSLVVSEENLGFARGNNLGISYAREHFDPDFIVAANSDIIFEQADYGEKIREIYERHRFDLLGGDILDANREKHLNPVATKRQYTLNYMRKQVLVSFLKACSFRLIKALHLKGAVAGHYGIVTEEDGSDRKDGSKNLTTREVEGKAVAADDCIKEEMEDVLLHGCCLIFSRDFFQTFSGFYEETFLYAEEEILYYLALKQHMTVLYSPEIRCVHKEAVTTSSMYRDFCDGKIFYFSNITRSYRLFLRLMKEQERKHE
jgi:GT2 family glycosyltransferase